MPWHLSDLRPRRSAMHQLYYQIIWSHDPSKHSYINCYSWIWIYWRKVLAASYTPNLAMVRRNNMSNVVSWLVWWVAFVPNFSKVFWPREIDWVGRFCVIFFVYVFSVFFSCFLLICFKLFFNLLFNLFQFCMFVVVVLYCVQMLSEELFISIVSVFFMSSIDPK